MRVERDGIAVEKWLLAAIVRCLQLGPDLTDVELAASARDVLPGVCPEEFRRALAVVRRGVILIGPDGREFGRYEPDAS